MMDIKTKLVLKILANECHDGNYKIVETSDIILSLPKHYRMDFEAIKHILAYLERQDIISIKYDDDGVYCLAVLPYGFEILESEKSNLIRKDKSKEQKINITTVILSFVSALIGTILGIIACYFIIK